ncbi:Hypothetical protein ABZS17H1_03194 [Kosakonia cowanii]
MVCGRKTGAMHPFYAGWRYAYPAYVLQTGRDFAPPEI